MQHLEETILSTATIQGENGPITLQLFHDTDAYRWYQADGADTEVSGETPEKAKEAAEQAWGRNWGFIVHGAGLKECMNCGAALDGTEDPADFCDADCEHEYYGI